MLAAGSSLFALRIRFSLMLTDSAFGLLDIGS